jgi:hypothetical protein
MSKKAKRIMAKLYDPKLRERALDQMHKKTVDDVAPVGGGTDGPSIVQDINKFEDDHARYMESLKGVGE